jgi:glycogen debranching enzyme
MPGPAGPGDVIHIEGRYYILASSSRVDDRTQVLKDGETFAVLDRFGDIAPVGAGNLGLYHEGTRFLSRLALRVGGERPLLLSSTVKADNTVLVVDLTNPDLSLDGTVRLRRGTVHIAREILLWGGVCYERLHFVNYGTERVAIAVTLAMEADFADLFEVRGLHRPRRGEALAPVEEAGGLVLAYRGLDGVLRRTRIACAPPPDAIGPAGIKLLPVLEPRAECTYVITHGCENGNATRRLPFAEARERAGVGPREQRSWECAVETSNAQVNAWLRRSFADLHLMTTKTPHGWYPYAGVPWFSTPFGRDGILTALQMLWVNPALARGVLAYLGATQATDVNAGQDAEPGKILHEARLGEMAALGEIPFGRYYGSVDATPLFVVLAGAYLDRTGDLDFVAGLWPNVERALAWIDAWGDVDRDGFVEYHRQSPRGLVHQGWKDSGDAVFHADGALAAGPIALCEVQGYAYAALLAGARIAQALGHTGLVVQLVQRATELKERFEERFWCEDLGTYALALDGEKRPCRVRTSNPGHCLYAGIAAPDRARRVMEQLLSDESFSGWGLRTVARTEARYNPMSYHNGSVWPHDNALIAAGLARYGWRRPVFRIMTGLFDATVLFDLNRLPELFCGFERRPGAGPTLYPVACAPQAWSAATPFLLLQSCLGLSIAASERRVSFFRPQLPDFLDWVRVRGLQVARDRMDLMFERKGGRDVGLHVERRTGRVEVRVVG